MKWVNKFIQYAKTFNKYSDNTLQSYQITYKQFDNYIYKDWLEVGLDDIEGFIAHLKNKNGGDLKSSTINAKIAPLKSLYSYLKARNYVDDNPIDGIERPQTSKKIKDILTRREVNSIISKTDNIRNKAIVALLFVSGCRVSELVSLDRDNISDAKNEENNVIGVKIHIEDAKEYKDRMIYVTERYFKYVRNYLESRNDTKKALFISNRDNRLGVSSIQKFLENIDYINKDITPHMFRRSCATYLYNKGGMTPTEIKDHLGHANVETTLKNYIKVYDDSRKEKTIKAFE